jgi:hypothetical protein
VHPAASDIDAGAISDAMQIESKGKTSFLTVF